MLVADQDAWYNETVWSLELIIYEAKGNGESSGDYTLGFRYLDFPYVNMFPLDNSNLSQLPRGKSCSFLLTGDLLDASSGKEDLHLLLFPSNSDEPICSENLAVPALTKLFNNNVEDSEEPSFFALAKEVNVSMRTEDKHEFNFNLSINLRKRGKLSHQVTSSKISSSASLRGEFKKSSDSLQDQHRNVVVERESVERPYVERAARTTTTTTTESYTSFHARDRETSPPRVTINTSGVKTHPVERSSSPGMPRQKSPSRSNQEHHHHHYHHAEHQIHASKRPSEYEKEKIRKLLAERYIADRALLGQHNDA